ncbi:type I polyketide synthase [Aspergillus ibericus CBS 121593]|uniref:Uncharacterized protein n=1 Tax=Aspergillus ibericus CBS 121593 TaxID=1448316 RepID=A0A395HAE6_9EURO|nr:hypothetical protein BO80DRAFT_470848 [Aspergillus ibericus CBS 121593]RAL03184.1 hypothetical protein BO80DRAFT_470848 [Aspergillus ibericus CBS 121593]
MEGILWEVLLQGKCTWRPFPRDRFNVDARFHDDPERGGTFRVAGGHFLAEDLSRFEAGFFSISQAEAELMDPQHRLLLENVYQALENSGISLEKAKGTDTTVYAGCFSSDYGDMLNEDPEQIQKHKVLGEQNAILANRISWFFDFKGASATVDTACSGGLIAVHMACQNLILGESNMAIASGVNIISYPCTTQDLSKLGALSPDGPCYSFDERANGCARGEGIGTVVLKRLSTAVRDGDTIRAVIRATAANQDGRTTGIFNPSADAQARLIRTTYKTGGIEMDQTAYVEAHGTGTSTGDPAELRAIASAFADRTSTHPLYIGSNKSALGHTESAAGILGLIKTVLSLESGLICPNVNLEKLNPAIRADEWRMEFPTAAVSWPKSGPRVASISSFGFGGTNAHAVICDAYHGLKESGVPGIHLTRADPESKEFTAGNTRRSIEPGTAMESDNSYIFAISSFDQDGVQRQAEQLSNYVPTHAPGSHENEFLRNLSYTLDCRRTQFGWRAACPYIGFVFTGQGIQWKGMGRGLMRFAPYRKLLHSATAFLRRLGATWSATELLTSLDSDIDDCLLSHPLCTALQVAVVDCLRGWNIVPHSVAGHSSGEIAAAYAVGAINRTTAWFMAFCRGLVSKAIADKGATMMAVRTTQEELLNHIEACPTRDLTIAAFNSPTSYTERLESEGTTAKWLNVENAYHSPHMEGIVDDYIHLIKDVETHKDTIRSAFSPVKMISTVTGCEIQGDAIRTVEYWGRNLLSPVRFSSAIKTMCVGEEIGTIVEIGPHSTLKVPKMETLQDKNLEGVRYLNISTRNIPTSTPCLQSLSSLRETGYPVNLAAMFDCVASFGARKTPGTKHGISRARSDSGIGLDSDNGVRQSTNLFRPRDVHLLTALPPYSFNHSMHDWKESRLSRNYRFRQHPRSNLLGAPVNDWNSCEPRWRNFFRVTENPWMADHVVSGKIIFPGVGYVTMAIEATKQIADPEQPLRGFRLRDVHIHSALIIPDTADGIETGFSLLPVMESMRTVSKIWKQFHIYSYSERQSEWSLHCTGQLALEYEGEKHVFDTDNEKPFHQEQWEDELNAGFARCRFPINSDSLYDWAQDVGFSFGKTFRNMSQVKLSTTPYQGESAATVTVADIGRVMPSGYTYDHVAHPTTLDALMHTCLGAVKSLKGPEVKLPMYLPNVFGEIWVSADISRDVGHEFMGYSRMRSLSHLTLQGEAAMTDKATSSVKVVLTGVELVRVDTHPKDAQHAVCHTIAWKPDVESGFCGFGVNASGKEPDLGPLKMLELNAAIFIKRALAELEGDEGFVMRQKCGEIDAEMHSCLKSSELKRYMGDQAAMHQLQEATGGSSAIGNLCVLMGRNLSKVIKQEMDPLELMFGDDLANAVYDEFSRRVRLPGVLKQYLDLLGHKCERLTVLEVGGGTGATTIPMLNSLCPVGDAISKDTWKVEKLAADMFKSWEDIMQYQTFDIERDPKQQGLGDEKFDVILAGNVVHATRNVGATLLYLRSLLKPQGRLVLHEIIKPSMLTVPMIFGLLPGWWLDTGFMGINHTLPDSANAETHLFSILVARVAPDGPSHLPNNSITIVKLDPTTRGKTISSQLAHDLCQTYGSEVCHVMPSENVSETDMHLLICADPQFALCTGLIRTSQWEYFTPKRNLVILNITMDAESSGLALAATQEVCDRQFITCTGHPNEEYVLKHGQIYTTWLLGPRVIDNFLGIQDTDNPDCERSVHPFNHHEGRGVKLHEATPIKNEGLVFVEDHDRGKPLRHSEVEVEIKAVGVNFRDLLTAMVNAKSRLSEGDRVMILADPSNMGTIRTYCRTHCDLVVQIPDSVSFEMASALPVTALTVLYSLRDVARLSTAAIRYAQAVGAVVFTTVSSGEKRQLLMDSYDIPENRIFYSRDGRFAERIKLATGNRGVDVVLNSLGGELLVLSWSCLAPLGRFIELGKRDILDNGKLPMRPFAQGTTFSCVDLSLQTSLNPARVGRLMTDALDLYMQGKIGIATPLIVFKFSDVNEALRRFQTGESKGKMVLLDSDNDKVRVLPHTTSPLSFPHSASYVIAGGVGGLGREIARWMAYRGARHLILLSRSGGNPESVTALMNDLQTVGCEAMVVRCNIADCGAINAALKDVRHLPPIKGCIQAAMELKDMALANMAAADFKAATSPKVQGSWNLHSILPSDMDFFIMLSSIGGIVGTRGAANYAAGNTFQDELARYRSDRGLPSYSIDLRVVASAGYVAENWKAKRNLSSSGSGELSGIRMEDFFRILEHCAHPGSPPHSSLGSHQIIMGLDTAPIMDRTHDSTEVPAYQRNALWANIRRSSRVSQARASSSATRSRKDACSLLNAADSWQTAVNTVVHCIQEKLASMLCIPLAEIDPHRRLSDHGVDSLTAVEFRTWMNRSIGADIPVLEIMGSENIDAVSCRAAGLSVFVRGNLKEAFHH